MFGKPFDINEGKIFQLDNFSEGKGLFNQIQIDIIGPFNCSTTKETRITKGLKVWALVIIDMLTSAINIEIMNNYSEKALVLALSNHTTRFKSPEIVTHDAGTQIMKLAKETNKEDIINASRKYFKNCKFIPCPPESQWRNGKVEANIKNIKVMLRSYFGKTRKQVFPNVNLF